MTITPLTNSAPQPSVIEISPSLHWCPDRSERRPGHGAANAVPLTVDAGLADRPMDGSASAQGGLPAGMFLATNSRKCASVYFHENIVS
jgi:hypothetical protein